MDEINIREPSNLLEAFHQMMPSADGIIHGTVTQESPIEIKATNDSKLILTKNMLTIPRHLTDYKTLVDLKIGKEGSVTGTTTCPEGNGNLVTFGTTKYEITVYNHLQEGETVWLLSYNSGKKYFVLGREKGVLS